MPFKLFTDTGAKNREFISITENKSFGISRPFLDANHITSKHKAIIFYDKDTDRIAIHFTLSSTAFGFPVRIPNQRHGGNIPARTFFEAEKIDTIKYSGRYDNYLHKSLRALGVSGTGDAFVITLKKKSHNIDIDDKPIDLSQIPF